MLRRHFAARLLPGLRVPIGDAPESAIRIFGHFRHGMTPSGHLRRANKRELGIQGSTGPVDRARIPISASTICSGLMRPTRTRRSRGYAWHVPGMSGARFMSVGKRPSIGQFILNLGRGSHQGTEHGLRQPRRHARDAHAKEPGRVPGSGAAWIAGFPPTTTPAARCAPVMARPEPGRP